MKKSEFTHIIREIVVEEIRKELPMAIAEVFQNFMVNKPLITERKNVPSPSDSPPSSEETDDSSFLKQSLKELFGGGASPQSEAPPPAPAKQLRKFTKDPLLNEVLNQTMPFNSTERFQMQASGGGNAAVMMAAMQAEIGRQPEAVSMEEPRFLRNVPNMMPSTAAMPTPSVSQAELLRDTHAPMAEMPQGLSVLDLKAHTPPVVNKALTRNYSQMMKLIDKKKGKVA